MKTKSSSQALINFIIVVIIAVYIYSISTNDPLGVKTFKPFITCFGLLLIPLLLIVFIRKLSLNSLQFFKIGFYFAGLFFTIFFLYFNLFQAVTIENIYFPRLIIAFKANLIAITIHGIFIFVCYFLGKTLINEENPVLNFSVGSALFVLTLIFLGYISCFKRISVIIILFVYLFISKKNIFIFLKNFRYRIVNKIDKLRILWPLLIILPYILIGLFKSLSPPTSTDELMFYFDIAEQIAKTGKISILPENPWSYYPKGGVVLFGASMIFNSIKAARLVPFVFEVAFLFLIYFFCSRNFQIGFIPSIIFFTLPIVVISTGRGGIDFIYTFFEISGLILCIKGLQKGQARYVILSGITVSAALSTRYTSIFMVIFLFVIFLSIVLILSSPVYIHNFIATGDPIFPFFTTYFSSADTHHGFIARIQKNFLSFMGVKFAYKVLFPVVSPFFDYTPAFHETGISFYFLCFFPVFFINKKKWNVYIKIILGFSLFYLISYLIIFPQVIRYLLPALAGFSIVYGYILVHTIKRFDTLRFIILFALIIGAIIPVFRLNLYISNYLPVVLGLQSKEEYLKNTVPAYKAWEYINLQKDVRGVFLLFDRRVYYIRKKRYPDFNSSIGYLFYRANSVKEIFEIFKSKDINYIIVNLRRANLKIFLPWSIPNVLLKNRNIFKIASPVFSASGVTVFKLKN